MFISVRADHKRNVIQNDVHDSRYFSVLTDTSTNPDTVEQDSVFVLYIGKNGEVKTTSENIVDLESGNADD